MKMSELENRLKGHAQIAKSNIAAPFFSLLSFLKNYIFGFILKIVFSKWSPNDKPVFSDLPLMNRFELNCKKKNIKGGISSKKWSQ